MQRVKESLRLSIRRDGPGGEFDVKVTELLVNVKDIEDEASLPINNQSPDDFIKSEVSATTKYLSPIIALLWTNSAETVVGSTSSISSKGRESRPESISSNKIESKTISDSKGSIKGLSKLGDTRRQSSALELDRSKKNPSKFTGAKEDGIEALDREHFIICSDLRLGMLPLEPAIAQGFGTSCISISRDYYPALFFQRVKSALSMQIDKDAKKNVAKTPAEMDILELASLTCTNLYVLDLVFANCFHQIYLKALMKLSSR